MPVPAANPRTSRPRPRTLRKRLYGWHSWAGFQLALLSFIVLLSGTLAVLGDEIDWLLDENRRIEAFEGRPAWSAMYATVRDRYPGRPVQMLSLGELPTMAAQARIRLEDGRPRRLFLDPASGAVLGEGHWLSVQRVLRDFHRYLFIIPSGLGLPLVTVVALVLAVQLATGLVTVRKWGSGLVTLRANRGLRVFLGDLHRSTGLWSTWFTALMVVTSLWYFAEWVIHSGGGRAAAPMAAVSAPAGPAARLRPLGDYVAAAERAYPGFEPRSILFPDERRAQLIITGRGGDWLVRDRAARVTVDARDARVLAVQQPGSLTTLEYLADLADPWHFGDVGGLATKLLWFVFGLVLTGLSATGVWLTWRRTRAGPSRWHALSGGMLLVAAVFGTGYVTRYLG
ncbi:PepSY-associated TM helix domain-containing protein [Pseudohaliea sp.]|uniref:PepSY-associated TM helix domain-containing protein n=1 Tax=Pseudohaliea sp. TaxID=2740289 RepID=UPI0032EE01DE